MYMYMYLQCTAVACTVAVSSDLPYNWPAPLEVSNIEKYHFKINTRYNIYYSSFYLYLEFCHQHLDYQALIYIIVYTKYVHVKKNHSTCTIHVCTCICTSQ